MLKNIEKIAKMPKNHMKYIYNKNILLKNFFITALLHNIQIWFNE